MNTTFIIVSFEGPDRYSLAGGLGMRVSELSRALARQSYLWDRVIENLMDKVAFLAARQGGSDGGKAAPLSDRISTRPRAPATHPDPVLAIA